MKYNISDLFNLIIMRFNPFASVLSDIVLTKSCVEYHEIASNIYDIHIDGKSIERIVKVYKKRNDMLTEFKRLMALNNINSVPRIYCHGRNNLFFNVIEKVPGKDLSEYSKLKISDIKDIVYKLLKSLKKIHKRGVIHKDIKLENVIYDTETKKLHIIDFEDKYTKHYRSPEHVLEYHVNSKTDMWSLGIMIYKLVIRKYPFENKDAILNEIPNIEQVSDEQIRNLLYNLLEKNPDDRISSEDAFDYIYFT